MGGQKAGDDGANNWGTLNNEEKHWHCSKLFSGGAVCFSRRIPRQQVLSVCNLMTYNIFI
jgi:hypothetical protein